MTALGWIGIALLWVFVVAPIGAVVVGRCIRAGRGPTPGR